MRYRISPVAIRDLEQIDDHLATRNPMASIRLLQDFTDRWSLLATQPRSGRPRDDVLVGLRSVVVGSYIAFYYIEADVLVIARVLHGHRDITEYDFQN